MFCKMSSMFGWDLIYRLVEHDISKKEDILVLLAHWYLIKYGFKCLGVGESKILVDSEDGGEVLPDGWNRSETYALRYVHNKQLYILRAVKSEGDIIFNFLRVADLSVSNISFNVEDTVRSLRGPIETLIPTYKDAIDNIQRDLLEPVFAGTNREATTQTTEPQPQPREHIPAPYFEDDHDPSRHDPLRIGFPRRGTGVGFDAHWDPMSVGRSDLDPFAGGGGGMIFNPFGPRGLIRQPGAGVPGGLPRGSVPPGARFDPIGPPGTGGSTGRPRPGTGFGAPDPDHLPPPGYDDMFM